MSNEEWCTVATCTTNQTPNSEVEVRVNTVPICKNMTNPEFRKLLFECRDKACQMISLRMKDLQRWSQADKSHVEVWFGRCDELTRSKLIAGLTAIESVLSGLTADQIVRWDPKRATHIACTPNTANALGAVAEVCAPDTETHTIAIREAFCEMRPMSYGKDSMVSTLIHEVSHFNDTMATKDHVYYMRESLPLGKQNPELAIENADSIAGYVIYD